MLEIILTEATCGSACWEAREDVCRCSCGGKNHGCLKTADGVRPERMAKIGGFRYVLKAIGGNRTEPSLYQQARVINQAEPKRTSNGYVWHWYPTDKGAPARVKTATKQQVHGWAELASHKSQPGAWKPRPDLLWVREDIASQASSASPSQPVATAAIESRAYMAVEELETIPR